MKPNQTLALILALILIPFQVQSQDIQNDNIQMETLEDVTDLEDYTPPDMFSNRSKPSIDAEEKAEISVFKIEEKKRDEDVAEKQSPPAITTHIQSIDTKKPSPAPKPISQATRSQNINIPIPSRRPHVMGVSQEFLSRLQIERAPQTPSATKRPKTYNADDLLSQDSLGQRLTITDIRDILAQIDPKAAAQLPESEPVRPRKIRALNQTPTEKVHKEEAHKEGSNNLERIHASSLPGLEPHIRIPYRAKDIDTYYTETSDLGNLLYIQNKMAPDHYIEIHGYAHHGDRSESLEVAHKRAKTMKAYMIKHRIPSEIIEIRAFGRKTGVKPANRLDIIFRKML